MNDRNTLVRTLHDVGAAVWLGGSLMGAVGLNGASRNVSDTDERVRVASAGWSRWAPFSAAAIGAHVVGGIGLVVANRGRVKGQAGVTANTAIAETPFDIAASQQALRNLQWVTPALTAAIVALGSQQGEQQQRPGQMLGGMSAKVVRFAGR